MSKYRRKTANARERQRMHQVNLAFEKLKAAIPHHKLDLIESDTKITTLRCAISYINALSELLTHVKQGTVDYFASFLRMEKFRDKWPR